jgi:hypothetical protein
MVLTTTSAGSSSSSSGSAPSINLTKAMLQQARGQLLVVQVAPYGAAAAPCTLAAVYHKHISGDSKGKAPACARPPDGLHMEQ